MYIKATLIFILLTSASALFARKNVVPVSRSVLKGIELPAGTKKDVIILWLEDSAYPSGYTGYGKL